MSLLPPNWILTTLGSIVIINPRHSITIDSSIKASFVPMAGVSADNWKFNFMEEKLLDEIRKGFTHFAEGDVLLAKITPSMENGKAAIAYGLKNGLGCGTTELHVLRPIGGINPFYIYHFIHQETFRREAAQNMTGTAGQLRVPSSFIENKSIPLPPLDEQHRIVAKLEKILSIVDTCRQRLEKIPLILKRFRQSVLAAACSGRLTEDWREKNSSVESVNKILETLYRTRLSLTKSSVEKEKIESIYQYQEENNSSELPSNWVYVALNKLCKSFDYGTSSKSRPIGKVPVLRMGNIQNGEIDWDDLVYSSDEAEIKKYLLKPNTVLFNRTNSPELVGKTAIYRGEQEAIFAGYLIRINSYEELNSEYLNYCLNTIYAKEFCLKEKTDGVSQSNINAQKLGRFEVPFCSMFEQKEIVRCVKALFNLADQLETRYQKAKSYVDKITQSILAKAFRGELVPQDPSDEPASLLLERIKAERANQQIAPKPKGRTKPQTKQPRKVDNIMLSKDDIKPTHLQDILIANNKQMTPEELWQLSELEIDDFYAQLKEEIDKTVVEIRSEINNKDRYLEAKI